MTGKIISMTSKITQQSQSQKGAFELKNGRW